MKKTTNKTQSLQMTRREFVGRTLLTAGAIAGAPALLRGQNLNNKLNIAFIACGGRANASLSELTIVPGRRRGDLSASHTRKARLLREASRLQYLGNAPYPRDRRKISEAVHADGQPGTRITGTADDQGDPRYRRDRRGARSSRLGRPRVGTARCCIRREIRQTSRLLQRHSDC